MQRRTRTPRTEAAEEGGAERRERNTGVRRLAGKAKAKQHAKLERGEGRDSGEMGEITRRSAPAPARGAPSPSSSTPRIFPTLGTEHHPPHGPSPNTHPPLSPQTLTLAPRPRLAWPPPQLRSAGGHPLLGPLLRGSAVG